jgi:DNA-binding TFAR19-related protein (PDSD5 family)
VARSARREAVAHELFHLPQVQARIAELSAEHLGDAKRRKEIRIGALMRTALDPDVRDSDRLRAIELSGKIDGDFVEQHEVTVLNEGRADRLTRARDRAKSTTLPTTPAVAS